MFQISTLCSWTSVAYTSMWGCRSFFGDAYIGDNLPNSTTGEWSDEAYPSTISTKFGEFQGFRCDNDQSQPELTIIFFSIYVVLSRLWNITMTQLLLCGSVINAVIYLPIYFAFLPKGISEAPDGILALQMMYQGFVPNLIGIFWDLRSEIPDLRSQI